MLWAGEGQQTDPGASPSPAGASSWPRGQIFYCKSELLDGPLRHFLTQAHPLGRPALWSGHLSCAPKHRLGGVVAFCIRQNQAVVTP